VSTEAAAGAAPARVRYASAEGRWVLFATVLGSGIAFLDGTVVSVALPSIGEDLGAGFAGLQWTVNGYALTLAGLLLLGGALGDQFGRRRMFVTGVIWFAAASLLCAVAPNIELLIAARALQGVGAALLTPASLAIIESGFRSEDRGAAIGAWSGLGGIAAAVGPFLGGYLVGAASWRLIFLINLPLAALVVWVALRHVPESRDPAAAGRPLDVSGAVLAAIGLAGVTYALTEGPNGGWAEPTTVALGLAGLVALAAFVVVELRSPHPMVPPDIFRSRLFTAANLVTLVVYAALGAALFLIPIQLQQVAGYSPLQSGAALIPLTLFMLVLSARAGRLAQRIGPRLPMTAGPIVAGAGLALLVRAGPGSDYLTDVLPGIMVFGLGLAFTVAPLTATVLGAAPVEWAGTASAINSDVARIAGLLAVAVVPVAAGISGSDYLDPASFNEGFRTGIRISAALCVAGGLLAFATIRRPPAPSVEVEPRSHCGITGPPPAETLTIEERAEQEPSPVA
jgi:EmrB/QacA subfamily drug resistance transporter